jgi:tRNA threonylcarbamoyladenosine biosynthesis protein TsaE
MLFASESPQDTIRLGREIGEKIAPGEIVFLIGDLGSGKTLLAKGAAEALGLDPDSVISPTFTIVLEHRKGRLPFYHMDFYRLRSPGDLEELGLEMYFEGGGVVWIEWPEAMRPALPPADLEIEFRWKGETSRMIEVRPMTEVWRRRFDSGSKEGES